MSTSFSGYLKELAADAHEAVEALLPEEQRTGYKSESSEPSENNDSTEAIVSTEDIVDDKQQEVIKSLNSRSLDNNETSKETIIMACLLVGFILGLLVGYYLL